MHRAGDEFLAGAALAEDQRARVGLGDGLDQLAQRAHLRAFADDVLEAINLRGAGAQGLVVLEQAMALGAAAHGVEQFLGGERLGEVIHRAGLDRLDGELGRGVGGEHQRGQVGPLGADFGQEFVAAHPAEPGVGDDHEEFLVRQQPQCFLGGVGGPRFVIFIPQHRRQGLTHVFLVINDQDWGQCNAHGPSLRDAFAGNTRMKRAPFPSSDSARTVPP